MTIGVYTVYISLPQKAPKEPILEEAELDFRPLEECDEGLEEDGHPRETKDTDGEARREPDRKQGELRVETVRHTVFLLPILNIDSCVLFLSLDVGRAIEEAPPAPSPPEPLPPSQPDRVEDPEGPLEKPLERPPAPEHRPEANKVPLHTPMSNTMLDSLPIPHTVAHTLTGRFTYKQWRNAVKSPTLVPC